MASKTGSSSPGELAMTFSTSDVAACCSSASASARCSEAVVASGVATAPARRPAAGRGAVVAASCVLRPPRLHGWACCSTWTGSVNENTEPLPISDSTQSLPPCISTMRREIDRPRPVPPFFLVAELSACWNSSKILPWSAFEMPGPLSLHRDRERAVGGGRLDDHRAGVGELDGVADEIEQHLGQPALVAVPFGMSGCASTLKPSFLSLASGSTALNTL